MNEVNPVARDGSFLTATKVYRDWLRASANGGEAKGMERTVVQDKKQVLFHKVSHLCLSQTRGKSLCYVV